MARSRSPDDGDRDRSSATADRDRGGGARSRPAGTAEWFAASTLRVVLAIVGLILVLFGLGMAMGVDLIGVVMDVLSTEVGRWLLVALVGLVIMIVAVRGFGVYYGE